MHVQAAAGQVPLRRCTAAAIAVGAAVAYIRPSSQTTVSIYQTCLLTRTAIADCALWPVKALSAYCSTLCDGELIPDCEVADAFELCDEVLTRQRWRQQYYRTQLRA
eukprot:14447-Heterococcus_DN1.PRE.2